MSSGTIHFVFVHGAMHGAWCWYKIVDLLQRDGHQITALDLKSAGTSPATADSIKSFEEYNLPLMDFLASLPPTEKIVLVGHSLGGVSVAYASEAFPHNIAVAVYVTAFMFRGGDRLTQELASLQLDKEGNEESELHFGDGTDNLQTSSTVPKKSLKNSFYGTSPSSDVTLASLLLRPFPTNVLVNIGLQTTAERYGVVPRVYIKTEKDNILQPKVQNFFIAGAPPKEVHVLECDHSPFFSAPDQLHQLLLEIAKKYN
eukprot:Gb_40806 [translate_table: standard]